MAAAEKSATALVQNLNRRAGCALTVVGTAELGETSGATFVTWPDGRHSVVTIATVPAADMRRTAAVLEVARARGLPVPRIELVVEVDDVVAVVQERLPGSHPDVVDAATIDILLDAQDGFAHLLTDRPEVPCPSLLSRSGQASSWHEPLEQYSSRSRHLLRRIQRAGGQWVAMSGDDLVHPDLTVSNVLLEAGRVTGVLDWNDGAFRGDRRFSLVKLLFDLTWEAAAPDGGRHHVRPSGLSRLETILYDTVEPDLLRSYWAHWTLTMLHWTIRSGDPDVVDLHLRLGEQGLT